MAPFGETPMSAAHRTIKVKALLTRARPCSQRVPLLRRGALTFIRLREATRASKLGVDEELELLHHVVVEGVGITRKRVHDPDPIVDAPSARRTARAL